MLTLMHECREGHQSMQLMGDRQRGEQKQTKELHNGRKGSAAWGVFWGRGHQLL